MAQQTKQEKIDDLHDRLAERCTEAESLEAELDEANRRIIQLGDKLKEGRKKVGKLKKVATFYRAQRDRVDAYLSAMIDASELKSRETFGPHVAEDRGVTTAIQEIPEQFLPAYGRRPRVQEPFSVARHSDGREYSRHRDQEPEDDWEDF